LNTDDNNQQEHAEMSRMIYLEEQDVYIPATYQGAPKICFHCRISGHVRKDCPELATIQCYQCKGFGHLRRHCRKERVARHFEEELQAYEETMSSQEEQDQPDECMREEDTEPDVPHDHEEPVSREVEGNTVNDLFQDPDRSEIEQEMNLSTDIEEDDMQTVEEGNPSETTQVVDRLVTAFANIQDELETADAVTTPSHTAKAPLKRRKLY
jgi:hypothetical protein